MGRPGFADRKQLLTWAGTVGAQSKFPRLIRRLILETAPGLVHLGIPADEGVGAGGWDGSVKAMASNAWVPLGLSLWELSVKQNAGVKADIDYANRTDTPDGSPISESTYVEVILRPWNKRASWARRRTGEARWKEVKAYGLDDVHTWVESAPVTWAWISEELGLNPYGFRSAERWWDAWSSQTMPIATFQLVLAGRSDSVKALQHRLNDFPRITTVGGPSLDEVCAFIAALAVSADLAGDGRPLSRMAFVNELSAWRSLVESTNPLILVPLDNSFAREVPSDCPHDIIVPTTSTDTADLELAPIDAVQAAQALRAAGLEDDKKVNEAGRLARRSLTALRRHLAVNPALHIPPWAEAPVSRLSRATLMAGRWSDRTNGDKQVLADLAGESYEILREKLATLATNDDPFVVQVGAHWHLVSAFDAWLLLRGRITEDDLIRLETAVDRVFGEEDPTLNLEPAERWQAAIKGKVRAFSDDLRVGMASSLALLAVHGDAIVTSGGTNGTNWANYLVGKLLKHANQDSKGDRWASLSDVLPLLAEAGPDAFLDAVRAGLVGDDPVIARIFRDSENDGLFSSNSPHTGLLWALEGVAWSPDHFGAVIDLLARLNAVDPGGRLSNRPFESIARIFCPWHPENTATIERRLNVVDGLRTRHPATGWKLLMSMLPEFHGVHLPTHDPDFRDWKQSQARVTNVEYFAFLADVVGRSIKDAGVNPARWGDLIAAIPNLPPDDRARVVAKLFELVDGEQLNGETSDRIWHALRQLVGRHREFADAEWALQDSELSPLDDLTTRLTPPNAYQRHLWLFQDWTPALEDSSIRGDHGEYERALAERRSYAVAEIDDEGGMDAVLRLAQESEVRWSVGMALAEATGPKYDVDLLLILGSDDRINIDLAGNYYAQRFRDAGWSWLTEMLDKHTARDSLQAARLLLSARDFPAAWNAADARGPDVADQYWKNFVAYGLGADFDRVEFVAERLIDAGRNAAALQLMGMYGRGERASAEVVELIASALERLLNTKDPEIGTLSQHDFRSAFQLLEANRSSIGIDKLARLEWAYLPALGFDPKVPALHKGMAANPEFFVEVVCTVYRPHTDEPEVAPEGGFSNEEVEQRQAQAENGYRLLNSWRHPPGLVDGKMDGTQLHAWIDHVTTRLGVRHRIETGLIHFGQVLASALADADGLWPPEVVRDLLEELQSEQVEDGLRNELLNRRGVTWRGLEEGGGRERDLAAKYSEDADKFSDRWPRTAAVLRGIAKSYDAEGRRNEESAERFRRGLE